MTSPQKPRRILLAITSSGTGGAESWLRDLALGLDRQRIEPHVLSLRPLGDAGHRIREAGVPTQSFDMDEGPLPGEMLRARARLAGLIERFEIELVHAVLYRACLLTAIASTGPETLLVRGQHAMGAMSGRLPERILQVVERRFHHNIAVSAAIKRHLIDSDGVPPDEISVIHNGVDTQRFAPSETRWRSGRQRFGLPFDEPVVGFVGRLQRKKRVGALIAACRVAADTTPFHLALGGDGNQRDFLREEAERLGITDRVHFLGPLQDPEALLASIDVFALASKVEGMPMAALEAMASGVPSVATAVGGVPELLSAKGEREASGVLVDGAAEGLAQRLAAAITALLENPEERQRMGAVARQRAECELSVRAMIEAHTRLYLELIEGSKRE